MPFPLRLRTVQMIRLIFIMWRRNIPAGESWSLSCQKLWHRHPRPLKMHRPANVVPPPHPNIHRLWFRFVRSKIAPVYCRVHWKCSPSIWWWSAWWVMRSGQKPLEVDRCVAAPIVCWCACCRYVCCGWICRLSLLPRSAFWLFSATFSTGQFSSKIDCQIDWPMEPR